MEVSGTNKLILPKILFWQTEKGKGQLFIMAEFQRNMKRSCLLLKISCNGMTINRSIIRIGKFCESI